MVNVTKLRSPALACSGVLLLAAVVLTAAAWLRGAEYDEQYTLFLTAGTARPDWPASVFLAGDVAAVQSGHSSLGAIARDLRQTDVHPPLYFWAVAGWRDIFGPSLFAARLFSVLCGVASISLVGLIARRCFVAPALAMLLTLGCYGFVYTNAIARGFALAELLTLCGVALLLYRRPVLAGVCLGAACCCNYLAAFVATAAVLFVGAWPAALSAVPFLAVDAWFFAAQHAARQGQFPPFEFWPSLLRLAEYQTAAVFGGLPLYVDGVGRVVIQALIGLLAIALAGRIAVFQPLRSWPARLLLATTIAPPTGLLLLGAIFNNTPIELRYLSFGLPFIALLAAGPARYARPAASGPGHSRLAALGQIESPVAGGAVVIATLTLVFATQFAAITGLVLAPKTMQPARAAAAEAARLVGDGIVLLPWGNDGVGIVGAFAIEAPATLRLLLVRPNDAVASAIVPYHRVVLAQLAQDRDSTATIAMVRTALAAPDWRLVAIKPNLAVYERSDPRK